MGLPTHQEGAAVPRRHSEEAVALMRRHEGVEVPRRQPAEAVVLTRRQAEAVRLYTMKILVWKELVGKKVVLVSAEIGEESKRS